MEEDPRDLRHNCQSWGEKYEGFARMGDTQCISVFKTETEACSIDRWLLGEEMHYRIQFHAQHDCPHGSEHVSYELKGNVDIKKIKPTTALESQDKGAKAERTRMDITHRGMSPFYTLDDEVIISCITEEGEVAILDQPAMRPFTAGEWKRIQDTFGTFTDTGLTDPIFETINKMLDNHGIIVFKTDKEICTVNKRLWGGDPYYMVQLQVQHDCPHGSGATTYELKGNISVIRIKANQEKEDEKKEKQAAMPTLFLTRYRNLSPFFRLDDSVITSITPGFELNQSMKRLQVCNSLENMPFP